MLEYEDILDVRYPFENWNLYLKYPRMNLEDRAKIFSPFAALRGHTHALSETADSIFEISEEELLEDSKNELEEIINEIIFQLQCSKKVQVRVSYFVENTLSVERKGFYQELVGFVKKIEIEEKCIWIENEKISFSKIRSIQIDENS